MVLFSDGSEIGRFANENRIETSLDKMPKIFINAVFAAEDENFLTQPAISLQGMLRALWNNVRGNPLQGGSTITQQYVKLAYLKPERSIGRKLREIVIAFKLEKKYSKEEILIRYLNTVYFGRGCYGVETASNQFFGKTVSLLSPEESIALASMIRSPGAFSTPNSEQVSALRKRFEYVKQNMIANGWLNQKYAMGAEFPTILPSRDLTTMQGPRGYILEEVRKELNLAGFTNEKIKEGGFNVYTTLQRKFQESAERAVLERGPKDAPVDLHIGLAAIRPGTGEVLAIYGGHDYLDRQLNDATQGISQAGSIFKVFTLIAALEKGIPLSSIWSGKSPQTFSGYGERYRVSNYGGVSFGKMSLLQATANSVNTVFVRLGNLVGPANSVSAARRAGIPQNVEMLPTPSFVLGVSSPHVIDVATSFATFAAQGTYSKTHFVSRVTDRNTGKIAFEFKLIRNKVFRENVMADLTFALRNVVTNGTASRTLRGFGRPVAGKTGTSQNHASAWFAGFTPEVAASVALYRDNSMSELRNIGGLSEVTGGSFPAQIWRQFVSDSLIGEPITTFPRPAFIGGTKGLDFVNPSPKPTEDANSWDLPQNNQIPAKPQITIKPIPIPSFTPRSIP